MKNKIMGLGLGALIFIGMLQILTDPLPYFEQSKELIIFVVILFLVGVGEIMID